MSQEALRVIASQIRTNESLTVYSTGPGCPYDLSQHYSGGSLVFESGRFL